MDSSVQIAIITSSTMVVMWALNEVSSIIKNRKKDKIDKKSYDVLLDAEREIKLQEVFQEIHSNYPDAVVICTWGFHNGVTFFTGRHDLKMSMISEWVDIGVESGMKTMQNIRWKVFKRFITPLRKKSVYICHEFDGITDENGNIIKDENGNILFDDISRLHQNHGINTIVTSEIKNGDLTIGLLVMKFSKKMNFSENQLSDFTFLSNRISSIL